MFDKIFFSVTFIPRGGEIGLVDFDFVILSNVVTVHSLVTVVTCFMGM